MYVARDEDGRLYLYRKKPRKDNLYKSWHSPGDFILRLEDKHLPKSINPNWSDPEPIKVKLVRKNK